MIWLAVAASLVAGWSLGLLFLMLVSASLSRIKERAIY
jgi:hypothetical protein